MGSLHSRYEGVVFEETMLVKVRGFIDDAKKECIRFLHECLYILNWQKVSILVIFDGLYT